MQTLACEEREKEREKLIFKDEVPSEYPAVINGSPAITNYNNRLQITILKNSHAILVLF